MVEQEDSKLAGEEFAGVDAADELLEDELEAVTGGFSSFSPAPVDDPVCISRT